MTQAARKIAEYIVLIAVTAAACGVMWYVSARADGTTVDGADVAKPGVIAQPKALVAVRMIEPEVTELTLKQSGKIRAWEEYSLGFEAPGRVAVLGENASGRPLDDGDRVQQGQVLARLDDRVYAARKSEAIAQLEQAASDLQRDRRLFETGRGAITEAEFQDTLTRHAVAKAQQEVAIKNLDDAVLVSPVTGAISKRMVEAGESVTANQTVFEIVENDQLLLVVDVPESRIRELEARQRQVRRAAADPSVSDPEEKLFRARVHLEGRDSFGERWPPIDAEVYRIAQVADERTKLFEVEIKIDNREGLLRPGMVATTEIVTRRLLAYRVPDSAVMFRDRSAYLFTIQTETAPVEAVFWQVGQAPLYAANRVDLKQWVDEGDSIVIPAEDLQIGPVVIRGQQRLTNQQHVRVVNPSEPNAQQADSTAELNSQAVPVGVN